MKSWLLLIFCLICNQSMAQRLSVELKYKIGYNPYDHRSSLPDSIGDSLTYKFDKNSIVKYLIKRFELSLNIKDKEKLLYNYIDLLIAKTTKGELFLIFDTDRNKNFIDEKKIVYKKNEINQYTRKYFKLIFPYRGNNKNLLDVRKPNLRRGGLSLGDDLENELFIALDEYSYWGGIIHDGKEYFDVIADDIPFMDASDNIKIYFNKKNDKSDLHTQVVTVGDTIMLSTGFVCLESLKKENNNLIVNIKRLSNVHPVGNTIGFIAPTFSLPDVEGNIVELKNYNKGCIIIDFWASWCKACRDEHPYLRQIYKKYRHMGFNIISISIDDNKNKWINAIKKDKIFPWTNLISDKGWNSDIIQRFSISSIPANFLISPNGVIVDKGLKKENLESMLKKMLIK